MRFTKGLHRCLRCDLTHGLRRQALFWLGGIGIVLIACLQLTMRHHSLSTAEYLQLEPHLTYGDYVFYLLHGMPEFVPGDQNFVPNLVWLLLHLYLACLIGSYPQRDLLEIGVQLWPRCGSRCAWWISKCIWTAVSCLLFYLLILGVPWLFLFFGMTPDLLPQREIQQYFSSAAVAGIPFGRMLVHTLLLPLLASIGSVSPYIGLFGTVWGIMNSFIGIAQTQTTNLAVVAPGIAEALLATAIGLVAAIPAVVIYNVFARQIGGFKAMLGDVAAQVLLLQSRDLDLEASAAAHPVRVAQKLRAG